MKCFGGLKTVIVTAGSSSNLDSCWTQDKMLLVQANYIYELASFKDSGWVLGVHRLNKYF